jgi:hypothetical protein
MKTNQIGHSKVVMKEGVRPSGIPFIEIKSISNDGDFEWKITIDAGGDSFQAEATLECDAVKTQVAHDVGVNGRIKTVSSPCQQ